MSMLQQCASNANCNAHKYTLRKFGMSGQINCLEKCFKIFAFYKTYVTSSSHIVCGFFGANAGSFTLVRPIFKRSINTSFSWWTFLEKSRKKILNCDNILIFFGQIRKIAMAVSNIFDLIACIKQAFFYDYIIDLVLFPFTSFIIYISRIFLRFYLIALCGLNIRSSYMEKIL